MGQSVATRKADSSTGFGRVHQNFERRVTSSDGMRFAESTARTSQTEALFGTILETPCGWIGYIGANAVVHALKLGYADAQTLRRELGIGTGDTTEADWYPELREKLQAYANGKKVSFVSIDCAFPPLTQFQQDVLEYVKRIPSGSVQTYGEVAAAVGKPGAARAVGTVMSSNRIPLIIPCHRVVAAGGKIGNYTSPRGTDMKRWLLDLEQALLPHRAK